MVVLAGGTTESFHDLKKGVRLKQASKCEILRKLNRMCHAATRSRYCFSSSISKSIDCHRCIWATFLKRYFLYGRSWNFEVNWRNILSLDKTFLTNDSVRAWASYITHKTKEKSWVNWAIVVDQLPNGWLDLQRLLPYMRPIQVTYLGTTACPRRDPCVLREACPGWAGVYSSFR